MAQFHLAEEDMNFDLMLRTSEHPTDTLDRADADEFGDPLNILIMREEAQARSMRVMTLKNQPAVLGVFRRSKV